MKTMIDGDHRTTKVVCVFETEARRVSERETRIVCPGVCLEAALMLCECVLKGEAIHK